MKIILTGSAGRVGRAIFNALSGAHAIIGIDRTAFSTVHIVSDFTDRRAIQSVLEGVDAVIHAAALHAPHVGVADDAEFDRINVEGTRLLAQWAMDSGIGTFVFTSSTALYGHAVIRDRCTWIDELTVPSPRTIYHHSKLEAEHRLEAMAGPDFKVRVLRMSRSFPEPADIMAAYRLHRGVDLRDVADAHVLALTDGGRNFDRYVISAPTPFQQDDCARLADSPGPVIEERAPALAAEFLRRGWSMPGSVDRIYSSEKALRQLGWKPRFGYVEVLAQLDRQSPEVLPPRAARRQTDE